MSFLVADNIRAEAARRRLSQADLADLLDLSPQAISRRLLGEVPFRDSELTTIADHFGIEVSALFRESA